MPGEYIQKDFSRTSCPLSYRALVEVHRGQLVEEAYGRHAPVTLCRKIIGLIEA